MTQPLVVYVDIDDTLVRSVGTKRIPVPSTVSYVRALKVRGARLFCWSAGGGDYAREVAGELGIAECFEAFLPKPELMIDDIPVANWPLLEMHPNDCAGRESADELGALTAEARRRTPRRTP